MDRHHVAAQDAEIIVQDLDHRGQAVGGAGRGGNHRHVRCEFFIVDAHHDGGIHAIAGGGDDHFSRAGFGDQRHGGFFFGEAACAFQHHIDAAKIQLCRVAVRLHGDRAVGAAVMGDGDCVAFHRDRAGEAAMHAVVAEHMRFGFDVAGAVDRHRHQIGASGFDDPAQHQAPDAPKSVNRNLDGPTVIHRVCPVIR